MSQPQGICITSSRELRSLTPAWDDLWLRSSCAQPLCRAAAVGNWLDRFAPRQKIRILGVIQNDRWVAALPLVQQRTRRVLRNGAFPINPWQACGDLLLDMGVDAPSVLDCLVAQLGRLPWSLLRLLGVRGEHSRWSEFTAALERAGMPFEWSPWFDVAVAQRPDDWASYAASRSRKFRQQIRRVQRRLESSGATQIEIHRKFAPYEVEPLLMRGFEVENRSWKGRNGTSVLKSTDMVEAYTKQATELARCGQLHLALMQHDGRDIAFALGMVAKRTYFSLKIGYDDAFADYSPGVLLRWRLLKTLFEDEALERIDFFGPHGAANARFATATEAEGPLWIATGGAISRAVVRGIDYRHRRAAVTTSGETQSSEPKQKETSTAASTEKALVNPSRGKTSKPSRGESPAAAPGRQSLGEPSPAKGTSKKVPVTTPADETTVSTADSSDRSSEYRPAPIPVVNSLTWDESINAG
jgi:CelD/BcsL family acetyltransferase involved in cellulose biosynthesis